jgi:hypothetical protein
VSDPDEERRARDLMVEASALLRRVRKGELSQRALELLAALDHAAALEALGSRAPEEEPDLKRWVRNLDAFGPQVSARIVVACARALLPVLEKDGIAYREACAAVALAETWLGCPCDAHARDAQKTHTDAIAAGMRTQSDSAETAALVAAFAALVPTMPTAAMDVAADAADVLGEEKVRRTVRGALSGWALGEG